MYGGVFEDGDKQVTLADLYALDIHKMDAWAVIIGEDKKLQEWQDPGSSDEEGDGAKASRKRHLEDDDDDEDEGKNRDGPPPDFSGIPDFFFYLRGKKKPEPGKLTIFLSGKNWRYNPTLLKTCH